MGGIVPCGPARVRESSRKLLHPMRSHIAVAVLSACLAAFLPTATHAAPPADTFADELGGQRVTLPMVPGFTEAVGPAAPLRDLLKRALPPNYRIIGFQVPKDYLDKVRAHDGSASLARYCTVLTYSQYEADGMSQALFDQIKKTMREQSDKVLAQIQTEAASGIEQMSRDAGRMSGDSTASVKVGNPTSLGVFDEHPNSFALASIGPVAVSSKTINRTHDQASVMAIVLIHGKPINVNFYADYSSKADLLWAEDQARAWIRRVNELNP